MRDGFNILSVGAQNKMRQLSSTHEVKLEAAAPSEELLASQEIAPNQESQVIKTEMEKLKEALKMTQEIRQEIERAYLSLFSSEEK